MSGFNLVRYIGNEIAKQFTVPAVPVKPDPLAPLTAQVVAAQAEVDTTKAALAAAQAQITATATVAATLPITLAQADQVHATMAAATAKEVTDRQTAVASEATSRSTGDTANGNRATALEGRATVLETGAAAEQTARLAVAGRVTTLETGAGTEATARAVADTGIGNRVTTLETTAANFKQIRTKKGVVIPTIALLGYANVTITWATPFADANYTPSVNLVSAQDTVLGSLTYFITSWDKDKVVVRVKALVAFTTGAATLAGIGISD